jgi:hypothetical protein
LVAGPLVHEVRKDCEALMAVKQEYLVECDRMSVDVDCIPTARFWATGDSMVRQVLQGAGWEYRVNGHWYCPSCRGGT